jgi:UDPglucose 6-dehydrogenase
MKIGIIGYGFVGKAVANSFAGNEDITVKIHDPAYPDISKPIEKLKKKCEAIFICVPTPQDSEGVCDTSILDTVLEQLLGYNGIVISKCTAPPLKYRELESVLGLKLVHAPEFLTAANANFDYVNPTKIVIGSKQKYWEAATNYILPFVNFKSSQVECCSIAEAAMFKYVANTMLAMKVIMNNEYADLCEKLNINWENVAEIAETDQRLGHTHWKVPGPDRKRGFGGACFPKDTSALVNIAAGVGVEMSMLTNAVLKNKTYRNAV